MREMIWPEVPQWQRGCKEWINSRVVFPRRLCNQLDEERDK